MSTESKFLVFRLTCLVALVLLSGFGTIVSLATTQRHYELVHHFEIEPPSTCNTGADVLDSDGCAEALLHEWGKGFDIISAAALGAAVCLVVLVLTLLLAIGMAFSVERMYAWVLWGLAAAIIVSVAGSVLFLAVALAENLSCGLCDRMRIVNFVMALVGTAFIIEQRRFMLRAVSLGKLVGSLSALAVMGGAAYAVDAVYGDKYEQLARRNQEYQQAYGATLMQVCPRLACPSELVHSAAEIPKATESIVLSEGKAGAPVILMGLDMECHHCQKELKALTGTFEQIIEGGQLGLHLVLWSSNADCNPQYSGAGVTHSCPANVGLLCAYEHGAAAKAIDYIEWHLAATSTTYTRTDRREWLRSHIGDAAAACFQDQLALGTNGVMSKHAAYISWMRKNGQQGAWCRNEQQRAWWCFADTPFFAVFRDVGPTRQIPADERVIEAYGWTRFMHILGCAER